MNGLKNFFRGLSIVGILGIFGLGLGVNAENDQSLPELKTGAIVFEEKVIVEGSGTEQPEELFEEYIETTLYEQTSSPDFAAAMGKQGDLSKEEKAFYDEMMVRIKEIAAGKNDSTVIKLKMKIVWTVNDLGVTEITSFNHGNLVKGKMSQVFDFGKVISYLLMDCPYELYWYDKTDYSNLRYRYSYSSKSITVEGLEVSFPVVPAYQGNGKYQLDTSKIRSVEKAKNKAVSIVEETKHLSDYERLAAFKDIICSLTDYNHAAVENPNTAYGNPWQMIWVFDEDPSTNVVCEGYSKAFQYLCDLSGFTCYTVTGEMANSSGGGPHMWNLVTFGGKNYLVDVTNCDQGSIGYPNKLFMAGTDTGSVASGFVFKNCANLKYTYSDDHEELFGWSKLNLSKENFDPSVIETLDVFFETTEQVLPYKKGTMKILAPRVCKQGETVTDAKVTYMHREYGSGQPFAEGMPKGIGTFEIQAVANGNLYWRSVSQNTFCLTILESVAWTFKDIQGHEWYFDYVQEAYDRVLMTGIGGTNEFRAEENITKAQVAQVLYNMENQPVVTERFVFEDLVDVYEQEWYADAVAWAYYAGIITGDLYTKEFSPNANVTREQLALMIYRYAQYKGNDVSARGSLAGLKNDWKVNTYALESVKWAVGMELIGGIESKNASTGAIVKDLAPQGNATRAQMATILTRFCKAYDIGYEAAQ